jgi:NADH:ubiquinone oxidoreductase subunit E
MNQEELKQCLGPLIASYPHSQSALVPALHALLETREPIDSDALAVIAELCEVDLRSVTELVASYPIFQNGHSSHTEVCFGLPCYLNGAKEVFEQMKAEPNGNGSSKPVNISPCLGHCYAAPVIRLEDGSLCRAVLSKSNSQAEAVHG